MARPVRPAATYWPRVAGAWGSPRRDVWRKQPPESQLTQVRATLFPTKLGAAAVHDAYVVDGQRAEWAACVCVLGWPGQVGFDVRRQLELGGAIELRQGAWAWQAAE